VSQLPVYRVGNHVPSNQLLQVIAAQLHLEQSAFSPSVYQNTENTITISQTQGTTFVSYDNTLNTPSTNGEIVSLEDAKLASASFMKAIGYNTTDVEQVDSETKYLVVSGNDLEDTSPATSTSIKVVYRRSFDGIPVKVETDARSMISIYVSKKGVYKAILPSLFFETQKAQTLQLLSFDQIVQQVENGQYTILGLLDIPPSKTGKVTLKQIELVNKESQYRLDEKQQVLLPYVQFTGTALLSDSTTIPITLITPAVSF